MFLDGNIEIFWHKKINTFLPKNEGNIFFVKTARFGLHFHLPL